MKANIWLAWVSDVSILPRFVFAISCSWAAREFGSRRSTGACVDQESIRVFGTRGLECRDDEAAAGGAAVNGIMQQILVAVADRFVDNVPLCGDVSVSFGDGLKRSATATLSDRRSSSGGVASDRM
jgi:hypothetical protein